MFSGEVSGNFARSAKLAQLDSEGKAALGGRLLRWPLGTAVALGVGAGVPVGETVELTEGAGVAGPV